MQPRSWGPALAAYKRSRRNRGLQNVEELMEGRIGLYQLDNKQTFIDIPKQYSQFKIASQADKGLKHIPHDNTLWTQLENIVSVKTHRTLCRDDPGNSYSTLQYIMAEPYWVIYG